MDDRQRQLLQYPQLSTPPQFMLGILFLLIVVSPWGLAGILAWLKSQTPFALIWVLLGLIVGLLIVPTTGTLWLQQWSPDLFESQAGGIGYLVAVLPFLAYSGSIMGAWSIAIGYWWLGPGHFVFWQSLGLATTLSTGGLLPLAVVSPLIRGMVSDAGDRGGEIQISWVLILAIANGILNPSVVYGALWGIQRLIRF
jgi:hypothetical protein